MYFTLEQITKRGTGIAAYLPEFDIDVNLRCAAMMLTLAMSERKIQTRWKVNKVEATIYRDSTGTALYKLHPAPTVHGTILHIHPLTNLAKYYLKYMLE